MTSRQKEQLYLLVIILRGLINYRGGIINLKTRLVIIKIEEEKL